MLPNHGGQLEAVKLRHAHIHQHHGHVVLQQYFKRLFCSVRFDEVLAESAEHNLIAEQLRWLIIYHEDVDLLVRTHDLIYLSTHSISHLPQIAICAATCAMKTKVALCSQ